MTKKEELLNTQINSIYRNITSRLNLEKNCSRQMRMMLLTWCDSSFTISESRIVDEFNNITDAIYVGRIWIKYSYTYGCFNSDVLGVLRG